MSTLPDDTWAIVELMGHRRIAGQVSEVEVAGAQMLRVDVPGAADDTYLSQFYGGQAIYCLTPCDEETARTVAAHHRPTPVHRFELPSGDVGF